MSRAFTCTCGSTFMADIVSNPTCPACRTMLNASTGEPIAIAAGDANILPDGDILLRAEASDNFVEPEPAYVADLQDDGPDIYALSRQDDSLRRSAPALQRFWAAIGVIPLSMPASCLAYGPGNEWALAGNGLNVQMLKMKSGERDRVFRKHEAPVSALALSPDGRSALSADAGGDLIWWDLDSGTTTHRVRAHVGPVRCLAIAPDGSHALSGGADGSARLWDLSCGCHNFPIALTAPRAAITAVSFATDGRHFLAADEDGHIDVWSMEICGIAGTFRAHTEEPIVSVRCHDGMITALAAPAISTAPTYPKVFRWDLFTGRSKICFDRPVDPTIIPGCVALDREGWRMLIAGRPPSLPFHQIPMLANAYSEMREGLRDFFRIGPGSRDATNSLQVMSVNSGYRLHSFRAVKGDVISLAAAPDHTRVLAATTDGCLHVYATPET